MKKYLILGICLLLGISNARAQVTIGSNKKPITGALLELNNLGTDANVNSTRGLMLPRVKLTAQDQLFPMFEKTSGNGDANEDYDTPVKKADQDNQHIGLVVYNINKCELDGAGLYVWGVDGWEFMQDKGFLAGINFNKDYFDLPSGQDARPLTAQNLTIGWNVADNLTYTKNNKFGGGVPFTGANALPGSPLTVNPTSIDLLPTAMTISNPTKPWQSRETQLNFTDAECGNIARTITLNQTNYALKANSVFGYSQIIFTTPRSGTFDVEGNVSYKVNKIDTKNVLKTLTPSIDGILDKTINDYPTVTTKLNKTTFNFETNSSSRHSVCYLIFSDDKQPRRFVDITVAILSCDYNTNDGTLEDWVKEAGFTDADIAATPTGGTFEVGGQPVTKTNGVQMHKDQDGNLFLSGNFGYEDAAKTKERRWMLNNLSATTYAKPHKTNAIPVHSTIDNVQTSYLYPELPKTTTANPSTYYNANQKLGLFYDFDCASGGKEKPFPDDYETGKNPQTITIQGICPNGWHLPSDAEWTQLQFEFDRNINVYSGLEGGYEFNGYDNTNWGSIREQHQYTRGMLQACALKDTEPQFRYTQGASNHVTDHSKKPGFHILMFYSFATSSGSFNNNVGIHTQFWTSSTANPASGMNVFVRYISNFYSSASVSMKKDLIYPKECAAIRCKKTN